MMMGIKVMNKCDVHHQIVIVIVIIEITLSRGDPRERRQPWCSSPAELMELALHNRPSGQHFDHFHHYHLSNLQQQYTYYLPVGQTAKSRAWTGWWRGGWGWGRQESPRRPSPRCTLRALQCCSLRFDDISISSYLIIYSEGIVSEGIVVSPTIPSRALQQKRSWAPHIHTYVLLCYLLSIWLSLVDDCGSK